MPSITELHRSIQKLDRDREYWKRKYEVEVKYHKETDQLLEYYQNYVKDNCHA